MADHTTMVPYKSSYFTYWLLPILAACLLTVVAFDHTPVAAAFFVDASFLLGTFGAYVVGKHVQLGTHGSLVAAESHFAVHAVPIALALFMLIFWEGAVGKPTVTAVESSMACVLLLLVLVVYCMTPLPNGEVGLRKLERAYALEKPLRTSVLAGLSVAFLSVCLTYR